jgi:hypothetical protein
LHAAVTEDRHNPEYWRERAERARAQAEEMQNAGARCVLLSIAETYDQMAEQMAWDFWGSPPPAL